MTDPRVDPVVDEIMSTLDSGYWATKWATKFADRILAAADHAATITIEWGVRYSDSGHVSRHMSEGSARETADTHNAHDKTNWGQSFDMQAVSRTVTEWEEIPDDHPTT